MCVFEYFCVYVCVGEGISVRIQYIVEKKKNKKHENDERKEEEYLDFMVE